MQELPTSPAPSTSSKRTIEFRTLTSVFGNGYQQDMPDGINDEIVKWSVVYDNISKAERDAIIAVLKAAKSWDTIRWVDPDGVLMTYKMTTEGYSETRSANQYTISFNLKSVPGQATVSGPQFTANFNFVYVSGLVNNFYLALKGEL